MTKDQLSIALTNPNVVAFLKMIRHCEGTATPDGYRYMFGSTPNHPSLIPNYMDHPRKYFDYTDHTGKHLRTSAAGAYQFIISTWDSLKSRLGLYDFTSHSQDLAALELIAEQGALTDIERGQFDMAINKVKKIWASLPGSGNNQPEKSLAEAKNWYQSAGGVIV